MALLAGAGFVDVLDLPALDAFFALRGKIGPRAPITIVAIDESSLRALDTPWPPPRALHGYVLERLGAAGAAAIGLDLILSEPSVHGPADDEALAESAARVGRVVVASAITEVRTSDYRKVDANIPVLPIRRSAAAWGALNVESRPGAIVRRAPLTFRVGALEIPSFGVALHRVAAMHGVSVRPLPRLEESVRIDFVGGPGTFPSLPYHAVLRGSFAPESVRGRVVLVGRHRALPRRSSPHTLRGCCGDAGRRDPGQRGRHAARRPGRP